MLKLNWDFIEKRTTFYVVAENPEGILGHERLGILPNLPDFLIKTKEHPANHLNANYIETYDDKYPINLYSYVEDYMMDDTHTLVEIIRSQSVLYIKWCENYEKVANFLKEYGYDGITQILKY